MSLSPDDVFTPGGFPEHTYVDREEEEEYEYRLLKFAVQDGILPSVLGPSKSGKTVLAEKVLGDRWVRVSGAEIGEVRDLWTHVLKEFGLPIETSESERKGRELSGEVGLEAKTGVPFIADASGDARGGMASHRESTSSGRFAPAGMRRAIEVLKEDERILVIDDFHYVPDAVKVVIAQQMKEALTHGLQAVIMAVPHRSDDPIRSNADLRGRVASIDLGHWNRDSLMEIGRLGFPKLEIDITDADLGLLADEALGSPQLMQALCLETAYYRGRMHADGREWDGLSPDILRKIARRVSDLTDATTAFQILSAGPKVHGKERTTFPVKGGGEADNYELILQAIAENPPRASFSYDNIRERVSRIVIGDPPPMDRITRSLGYLEDIIEEKLQDDRVIAWDSEKQVLDIVDPHFLFYLRWRIREGN